MKYRIGITLAVILLLVSAIFLFGAANRSFDLTLADGGEIIISKKYQIDFSTKLKVFLYHKGDYGAYYDNLPDGTGTLTNLNDGLQSDIDSLAERLYQPPKDAAVGWDGANFTYTPQCDGVRVDTVWLERSIYKNFSPNIRLELKKDAVPPIIYEDFLKQITVETARFSTGYASSSPARKHNIGLAASFINGTVIENGGRLSFNTVVGKRTAERGFLEANIISKGHFVKGVGGGVCQVSTTLYNAAIRAGLNVIAVSNHSLPVGYVPLSFDAMVSSCTDLVLENTSGHPVYIKGSCDGNRIEFTFFGKCLTEGQQIVYRSEVVKVIVGQEYEDILDSSLLGQDEPYKIISSPKSGYISEGYKDVYEDGKLISSQKVRRDIYMPQKGVRILPDKVL